MSRSPSSLRALLAGSTRADRNGWIYLRIAGSPYRRGFQHGYLLAAEIRAALRSIRYLVEQDTGLPFDWFAQNARAMFEPALRGFRGTPGTGSGTELLEEMQGIVDGANYRAAQDVRAKRRTGAGGTRRVTPTDLIGWNAYPELICQWFPAVMGKAIQPKIPLPNPQAPSPASHRIAKPLYRSRRGHDQAHSCSAFVAVGSATADGGVVIGHTTWQSFANGDAYNLILDLRPTQGHRLLMQSVPGYVHSSTDFCLTGGGLAVAETSINVNGFDPAALPEFFRSRRACQYAAGIEQWRDLFREGNNGGYANTWLLADARRKRIAAYELTLDHDELLPILADGYYASCNIPLSFPIRKFDAGASGYENVLKSGARRVRFDQLLAHHRGRIDAGAAVAILADHYDSYQKVTHPCGRSICGHLDNDDQRFGGGGHSPFFPWGSLDGKVATGAMILEMSLLARWGRACGTPFNAAAFHASHPQYDWLKGHMKSRPSMPYTLFPLSEPA
jgi:hypothetical protein